MTISQERMIALINAGRDYQYAFKTLCERIGEQCDLVRQRQLTAGEALAMIASSAGEVLLTTPGKSEAALEIEYRHFRANMGRNAKAKIKQERKRRDAGVPTRQSDLQRTLIADYSRDGSSGYTASKYDSSRSASDAKPFAGISESTKYEIERLAEEKLQQEEAAAALRAAGGADNTDDTDAPQPGDPPTKLESTDPDDPENAGDDMLPTGDE